METDFLLAAVVCNHIKNQRLNWDMDIGVKYFLTLLLLCRASTILAADSLPDERHRIASMRMIGHQTLIDNGDSTSRVLPIKKVDGSYLIRFSDPWAPNQKRFSSTMDSIIRNGDMAAGYQVEIKECVSGDVVYSYEVLDIFNGEMLPCRSRLLPEERYDLYVTLLDIQYPLMNASLDRLQQSGKVERFLMASLMKVLLASLVIFTLILVTKKREDEVSDDEVVQIGKYTFDKRNLQLGTSSPPVNVDLSSKEAELLSVLYSSANNTIRREVILKKVWSDDGDYIGRTLDVFISKLRKKLGGDPGIRIINIRGVGYRLVVNAE